MSSGYHSYKDDRGEDMPLLWDGDKWCWQVGRSTRAGYLKEVRVLQTLRYGFAALPVVKYGAEKYAWGSWKYVPNGADRYANAARRHLFALAEELYAAETSAPHQAHALCNFVLTRHLLRGKL